MLSVGWWAGGLVGWSTVLRSIRPQWLAGGTGTSLGGTGEAATATDHSAALSCPEGP